MKDDFTKQELEQFAKLNKEIRPPTSLEKKVIARLRKENLIRTSSWIRSTFIKSLGLTAIGILILLTSHYVINDNFKLFTPCTVCHCEEVKGFSEYMISGRILILGEVHGTKQAPNFVQNLTCISLQADLPVTVALELPIDEQEIINQYLQSNGKLDDKQKLLQANSWSQSYQDGRNSEAMFDLLEFCRKLIREKKPLEVILIDDYGSSDRDYTMAENLLKVVDRNPNHIFIALVGNVHNQINQGSGRMGDLMLQRMGSSKVLSLNQLYGRGSAWVCSSNGCGIYQLSGRDGISRGILIDDENTAGYYHGYFAVGAIEASTPAKEMKLE